MEKLLYIDTASAINMRNALVVDVWEFRLRKWGHDPQTEPASPDGNPGQPSIHAGRWQVLDQTGVGIDYRHVGISKSSLPK